MDVVELTRQLGAAIQQDERYIAFMSAKDVTESDADVKAMMDKIENVRTQYQDESQKETPDEQLLEKLDQDFQACYASLMTNEHMASYDATRQEIDKMMNYLMQILYLSVNGEDPMTCEPEEEHECGGECSSCGGC